MAFCCEAVLVLLAAQERVAPVSNVQADNAAMRTMGFMGDTIIKALTEIHLQIVKSL